VSGGTVLERFHQQVAAMGDRVAMRHREGGEWRELSWDQYARAVRETALGLVALGVERGDAVGILSGNRPEWHISDLATMAAGALSVPVYPTSSPAQVSYVTEHSEARLVFVENEEQLLKVDKRRSELPKLLHAVVFEDFPASPDGFVLPMSELRRRGSELDRERPSLYDERRAEPLPGDVATVVYTSGTTGPPKGAMLTHANILSACESLTRVFSEEPGTGRRLSFLPLSHIAERVTSHFLQIYNGYDTWFAESLDALLRDLQDCRPTVFFAVPRLWEKFHAGIQAKLAGVPEEQRGSASGPVRASLGLDLCTYFVSGAAPISPEVLRALHSVGIPIAEVYGQTEDCGPTTLNPRERIKIGTVGPAIPGVEVRIADDGEVLVRGGNVFAGYFRDDEATAEMLRDGWMHTGDVGVLDDDGYLTITDRKKDLIITAAGKNVAPQEIENRLKYHPLVSQAVVIGDRRPYLVALLTLDQEAAARFAADRGLDPTDPERLSLSPEVLEAVGAAVDAVNAQFSRAESVRRWSLLPRDFAQEREELTPTLKVRRRLVMETYAAEIEALYA
jgi:long-chain acyl-CoA synthetase